MTSRLTAEGNLTTFFESQAPDGSFSFVTTGPAGDESRSEHTPGGWSVFSELSCGTAVEKTYGLIPGYRYRYLTGTAETTEAGLVRVLERDRTYQDLDGDGHKDLIFDRFTLNGKPTDVAHDLIRSEKTVTSPEGRQAVTAYDPATYQAQRVSVPSLFDTTYDYYADGRLKQILTGSREWYFSYDTLGNLHTARDPRDQVTTFEEYDAAGRVKAVRRPDNTVVRFDYDLNGNMEILTTPSEISHEFGYSAVNRNDLYRTPISGEYVYRYDRDRRLTEMLFPSGRRIEHVYADGRLDYTLTPEGTVDYSYYCGSKIQSVTQGSEAIHYGYDASLITEETFSGTLNQTLGYTYNNDFNVDSVTYAGGTEFYGYDDDGLLTGAGRFTIGRNPANGLPESVGDGFFALTRAINGYAEVDGETWQAGFGDLLDWRITARYPDGRIQERTETVGGVTTVFGYTYDPFGRLLTVTRDGILVEEYRYDAAGTREYEMNALRNIPGRSFTYSVEDHLYTAGDAAYDYDLDGFLTRKTEGDAVTGYTYSSRGELLRVDMPDGQVIEYIHDPLGRRIARKVDGVITEKYLWSGRTTLLAVFDGSDNLRYRFEYADGRVPFAMTDASGRTYYLAYDPVGSLRIIADASGNVVKRIDYDSFGSIIADTAPLFDIPFGFAGGLHDRNTGLVRFGFRDYDPGVGRWTAKDPIGFAGGDTDLYGYCLGDPVNWVDSFGLDSNPFSGYVPSIAINAEVTPAGRYIPNGAEVIDQKIDLKPNLTQGERNAILGTAGGVSAIIAGSITGQPELVAGGIAMTAASGTLALAEALGGDTSGVPYDLGMSEVGKGMLNQIWDNGNNNTCP